MDENLDSIEYLDAKRNAVKETIDNIIFESEENENE